jgi:hypothetical protein
MAHLVVPLPVIAEWSRGRTDVREKILAATEIVASLPATQAAGEALRRIRDVDSKRTIGAIVMATAALSNAIVVTGDPDDFALLSAEFPGVTVLSG